MEEITGPPSWLGLELTSSEQLAEVEGASPSFSMIDAVLHDCGAFGTIQPQPEEISSRYVV